MREKNGHNRPGKRPFLPPATWLMIGLMLAAFALYIYHLTAQSLWRDEILSVGRARQPLSLLLANRNIVRGVESPDLHPPFYFLLLSGWRWLAGESEFAYRYPSVLAAVLAIPLFQAVGRRIWGQPSGTWAAFTAVLSSFYLWYAQEARMYALLVTESLLVLYTLWPLLQPAPRKRDYALFALASALMVYTHYTGVFLLGFALAAIVLVRLLDRRASLKLVWKPVTAVLLGLLLLAIPLYHSARELLTAQGFIAFSQQVPWRILAEGMQTFALGSANPPANPGWRLWPFVLLAGLGAFSLDVAPPARRWRAMLISVGGLVGTLLLFYLASFLQANYSNPRHLTVLSPFFFLLMGHGLATLGRRWPPLALLTGGLLLVVGSLSLWQTITNPPVVRDDVRALAAYIAERAQPGDAVIWHNAVMSQLYAYYAPDMPQTAVPGYAQYDETQVRQDLAQWQQAYNRLWFVGQPAPPFFDERVVPTALQRDWVPIDAASFPASWALLSVDLYQPFQQVAALPANSLIADLTDGRYHLRAVEAPDPAPAGRGLWLSLYWQLSGDPAAEPPEVCLRLLDSSDALWSDGCTHLRLPTAAAPAADKFITQQVWLPLPEGLAPIPYTLELFFNGATQKIGQIRAPGLAGETSHQPLAAYENGLNLLDVVWLDEQYRAGLWVLGNLLWQATEPLDGPLTVQARLVDWRGRVVAEQTQAFAPADYPEHLWQPGDVVRTLLAIRLPYRIDGRYRAQISLLDSTGQTIQRQTLLPGGQWTNLGRVTVQDWPYEAELPAAVAPLAGEVTFGDGAVQLAAASTARTDEGLVVDLYWRALRELDDNYGTFIHVGLPGQAPLVQGGGVDWERPLPGWRSGEIVTQSFVLPLPVDLPPDAVITVGLYRVDDPGVRLPLQVNGQPDADNAFELGALP